MRKLLPLLVSILLLCVCLSCTKKPRSTADVPRLISHSFKVSVAPFSQPTTPSELLLGRIPEDQGRITPEELAALDQEFKSILNAKTKRNYTFCKDPLEYERTHYHASAQPKALGRWVAYGQMHNAELLIVPQVLNWHERMGSAAGVTSSAHVHVEFFLLRVKTGQIVARSIFEEKQQALSENILMLGTFIKRRASWVSATELAKDGMLNAIKDLGL